MSKYAKEEQVKIVEWAMNLEAAIQSEKAQLSSLKNMRFKSKPTPPSVPETIKPVYPKPPKAKFSNYIKEEKLTIGESPIGKILTKQNIIKIIIAIVVLAVIGGIVMIFPKLFFLGEVLMGIALLIFYIIPTTFIVLFVTKCVGFFQNRDKMNSELAKDPKYVNAYNEAEKIAKEKQEELNSQYAKEKENYETQIIPKYNQELSIWEASQEMKINIISEDLKANLIAQENLYNETKLVPKNNRSLNDLIWIYEDMSTSEHDFERAIDMLNANKQLAQSHQIQSEIHKMNNNMLNSFESVYSAIENGNDIAEQINENLGKTRRSINIGNTIATAQRHNISKK